MLSFCATTKPRRADASLEAAEAHGDEPLGVSGRDVDLRVSTIPTLYGESVVMRILDQSSVFIRRPGGV